MLNGSKGNDLFANKRDILKNYFNPYQYNIHKNNSNMDINKAIKSESHDERLIKRNAK